MIESIERLELILPQKKVTYSTDEMASILRCNPETVRSLIKRRFIDSDTNDRGDIVVIHGCLIDFLKQRASGIDDIEEAIFIEGIIKTKEISYVMDVPSIEDIIRREKIPNFNISTSENYDKKPYYRLPKNKTKIKLKETLHKRFRPNSGISHNSEIKKFLLATIFEHDGILNEAAVILGYKNGNSLKTFLMRLYKEYPLVKDMIREVRIRGRYGLSDRVQFFTDKEILQAYRDSEYHMEITRRRLGRYTDTNPLYRRIKKLKFA